ncbi:MAG: hypothetical protein IPK12_16215 [Gemmatimonadetes bacterium]|nr:hypothetical protein [Gemmatimonadota bacterium]
MISSTERSAAPALAWPGAGLLLLLATGCARDQGPLGAGPVVPALQAGLAVSHLDAAPAETLAVQPVVHARDGTILAGVQGRVYFDPRALRYLGQPLTGEVFVLVNDGRAADGELRVASLRPGGLPEATADLRFLVLEAGAARSLRYVFEEAATSVGQALHQAGDLPLKERAAPPVDDIAPRRLEDWVVHFRLVERLRPRVAGDGIVYGDPTLNGVVDILDAAFTANVAVGNRPLLTEAMRDYAIAADVSPANLPGLGEASDPIPPGQNTDGSHTITILDAAEIANEAVGIDRPIPGQPIPGRTPRSGSVILTGLLTADRTLHRDTIYQLQGNVIVDAGVTLTIEAGTRIEGDGASRGALVVARAGNLIARGTRLEPVVFTCAGAGKAPGCWGGVVLNGLALVNHRDPGTLGVCPEKTSIGTTLLYGGCLVEDTSGVLQYVRIEYAGMSAGSGPVGGLALLGVGTGTVLEHIQVHGSLGDGIYVSGGNANLRQVVLTGNIGSALHWDHGWGGNAIGGAVQFLQVQVPAGGGDAVLGSTLAGAPGTLPRSEPDLYNVTVVGSVTGAGRGIVLQDGSSGVFRNVIVTRTAAAGFDVEGQDACDQVSGGNAFLDHAILFGNAPDLSADPDCLDEVAYGTAPLLQNRFVDPGLIAAANTLTPDTRPVPGAPAASGAVVPPSNQFFDLTVTFVGAVEPDVVGIVRVPWYAGWTRGWSGPTP